MSKEPSYHRVKIQIKLYIKTVAFAVLVGGYLLYNLAIDSQKATAGFLLNPKSRNLAETPDILCPVLAADPKYLAILYFFGVIYLFIGLAIIADDFFCPALDVLASDMNLSQDVAGATLMAAGGSAPELFANLIGTFIRSDVGFGTIVGSAVFNVLFVVGFCSLVTATPMKLTAWPLLRDSSFYSLTLCILALFFGVLSPQRIELYEAAILFALYWLYVYIMYHNATLRTYFDKSTYTPLAEKNNGVNGQYGIDIAEIGRTSSKSFNHDTSAQTSFNSSSSPIGNSSSQSNGNGNGISHGGSFAKLETQSSIKFKRNRSSSFSNKYKSADCVPTGSNLAGTSSIQPGIEEEDDGVSLDFPVSGSGYTAWLWYIFTFPLFALFVYTITDVRKENRGTGPYAQMAFISCLIWMGLFSYYLVNWVEIIGATLGIPSVIMGLTFLAAGTSVPDMLAAVIVARRGLGDQAVSSSIGSNVFDVTVGLALPWLLFNIIYGIPVVVIADGFLISIIILFLTLFIMIFTIKMNGWELPKSSGYFFMSLYFLYVIQQVARSPYGQC